MPTSNLNYQNIEINDGLDAIVVINDLGEIPGGRTLDVSGVAQGTNVIRAGHILIQDDTTKAISPLGVTNGEYDQLPQGSSFVGVLKYSVTINDARASIVTFGQVNAAASPFAVTDTIKAGLPNIQFLY